MSDYILLCIYFGSRDTSGNGSSGGSSGSGTGSASGGSIFLRSESPAHHYSSVSPCLLESDYSYTSFHPRNQNTFYTEISNNYFKSSPGTIDSVTGCKLNDMMTIARSVIN